MAYVCPVCGFPGLTEPPRTPDSGASYEICPSCGFQFGFDDESEGIDYATWRGRWVAEGRPWRSRNPPPADWDPVAQLRALEAQGQSDEGERGQALIELGGLLVLVAIVVAALSAFGLPGRVASTISHSVGTVLGGAGGGPGTAGGTASAGTAGGTGSAGTSGGTAAAAAGPLVAKVQSAASGSQKLVDAGGNGWGNPSTLADHFDRHGGDFGSPDAEAYAQEAQNFLQRAVAEQLPMKIGPDGTIRVYEPSTNTFGAYNPNGTTKTYFKPDLAKNPNYWVDQKGTDPWSEPGGGNPQPGGGSGEQPGGGEGNGGEPGAQAPAPEPPAPEVPEIPEIPEIPIIP
jgi:hypothetical protein